MPRDKTPAWSFLTNHARVLLCIAQDPGIRLREIGDAIGITERATHRIVVELANAGYIARTRSGRRNHYTIQSDLPFPDPLAREQKIGDLLAVLAGQPPAKSKKLPAPVARQEKLDWRQVNEDPGGPTQSPPSRFRG
jgi:MarR family